MPPRLDSAEVSIVAVVVVALELGADLASWVERAVDVGIRRAGANRVDELLELAGRDALTCRADYVGGVDGAADAAGWRWTRGSPRRPVAQVRAEERADAAGLGAGAQVDVRLEDVPFEIRVPQPERDLLLRLVDAGPE
jgi:hypothetical protein